MNWLTRKIFDKFLNSAYPRSLAYRFRARRLKLMLDAFKPGPDSLVLDIGSYSSFFQEGWPHPERVVCLDVVFRSELAHRRCLSVIADVRALPFKDQSLDIICNSVLEHVGPLEEQQRAAAEITRVGRKFFVQIPYKFFPIDPHFFTIPYFQLLPQRCQRQICKLISVGYVARGDFLDLHYLTAAELAALFPGARIVKEKVLFLTKSLYALRA